VSIDYGRFARLITRSIEIADEVDANPIVVSVFKETLAEDATTYLALNTAVSKAMTDFAKENREALEALRSLDAPYLVARSAVAAILPGADVPETLKSQPTDTDKLNAVGLLIDVIDDHVGKEWADKLLAGEFGTKGLQTVKELEEAIDANKAVAKAKTDRATAYGPTYEKFLRFKQVVRNAYGPSSKQYKRLHIRQAAGSDTPPPAGGTGGTEP
jgi:hypothetical protein